MNWEAIGILFVLLSALVSAVWWIASMNTEFVAMKQEVAKIESVEDRLDLVEWRMSGGVGPLQPRRFRKKD